MNNERFDLAVKGMQYRGAIRYRLGGTKTVVTLPRTYTSCAVRLLLSETGRKAAGVVK